MLMFDAMMILQYLCYEEGRLEFDIASVWPGECLDLETRFHICVFANLVGRCLSVTERVNIFLCCKTNIVLILNFQQLQ